MRVNKLAMLLSLACFSIASTPANGHGQEPAPGQFVMDVTHSARSVADTTHRLSTQMLGKLKVRERVWQGDAVSLQRSSISESVPPSIRIDIHHQFTPRTSTD